MAFSVNPSKGLHNILRLLGRVEFESASTNGLTGLHGNVDRGRQRRLPWVEVLPPDPIVLLDARARDGLPSASIRAECHPKLIISTARRAMQHRGSIGSSATERMGERLVLRSHGGDRVRCGDVCALEIGRCEIGDAVSDGGGQLGDRLLNLGRVVVGLGLVRPGDPVGGGGPRVKYDLDMCLAASLLEQTEMGLTQRVDAGLEVFVLCEGSNGVSCTVVVFKTTLTLRQFGDFFRRNLAQTFSSRLNAGAEALCQFVGRLADVQVGKA